MKVIHIKEYLAKLGYDWREISLGDFDVIGDLCARRNRSPGDENWRKFGAFYRSDYERGIMMYHLIRRLKARSLLEIGTGRFYTSICAAKAFYDMGVEGRIVTVDMNKDEKFIDALNQYFPSDWLRMITSAIGRSDVVVPQINEQFDISYIDGDHSEQGTMIDWLNVKDKTRLACVFDDYHLPTKNDVGIKCAAAIDKIDFGAAGFDDVSVVRMDRRLFVDERGYTDEQVDYGQVYALKTGVLSEDW
jgi:hypothetical protein